MINLIVIDDMQPDDPRWGHYKPDGSIERWPATDVLGAGYEQINATVHPIDSERFVVIPPDGTRRIDIQLPMALDELDDDTQI